MYTYNSGKHLDTALPLLFSAVKAAYCRQLSPLLIAVLEDVTLCGIFGAVKLNDQRWDRGVIRALTWANRERGTDSLGFFDSTGKMTKGAGDPSEVLNKGRIKHWLNHSQKTSWFVAGHTRLGTRGKINRRNSHPFRYGRIIGSHNGMCDAPQKFTVDSEFLFWSLNEAHGDYQKALADISGYWGLSWFDGEHFYLMCYSGELSYDIVGGVFYYSSSGKHLDSCTGGNATRMTEGQVIRIDSNGNIENSSNAGSVVKAFKSTAYTYTPYEYCGYNGKGKETWQRSGGNSWKKESNSTSTINLFDESSENTSEDGVQDVDHEWQQSWAEYCTDSENVVLGHDDADNDHYAG